MVARKQGSRAARALWLALVLAALGGGCGHGGPGGAARARTDVDARRRGDGEAAACAGLEEAGGARPSPTRRALAVLARLRGCAAAVVSARMGVSAEELDAWLHAFVTGGRSYLGAPGPARPAELQAAWRGTWVLRARLAHGSRRADVDGLMILDDAESLTIETGQLDDDFAELPMGAQAGQPFRLGQYGRLQYLQREGSPYVVRLTASELVGSYSDFPRGMRANLVEPFVRHGDAFVHRPPRARGYAPSPADEMVLLGDRLIIGWSNLDVVDTWERVLPAPPPLPGGLGAAWERLKRSGALVERAPSGAAALLGLAPFAPSAQ